MEQMQRDLLVRRRQRCGVGSLDILDEPRPPLNQVRAIAEVATAVKKGEAAELKDNINTMISNLRETTESNREQDWLKTNVAKFTGMLRGQRELGTVGQMLLTELAPLAHAHQGAIYHLTYNDGESVPKLLSSYAHGGRGRAICCWARAKA